MNAPSTDHALITRMRRHRLLGLSEMAAGMAHEINQPLGGIRGFAEGLLIGLEEGWDISRDEIMAKMRRIIAEADRIDNLIQGVRTFASEDGRQEAVAVEVRTVVEAASRLMGARLHAHGVDWTIDVRGGPAAVRASPFDLQEVMQILLANAGDACIGRPAGAAQISITVDGGATPDDPVTVTVTDTGMGMDAATLARAGEPFFTTKGPDRGIGLGLAMAQGLVAQCGGQLALSSQPGVGTVATLRLWRRAEIA